MCYWNLDDESSVNKTISSNVIINKFQNHKYKFNDFYYFVTENSPSYHYKHYSFLIFPEVVTDNYIYFNNTNQTIKYTDIFNKTYNLKSIMFNFIVEPDKKSIDINSTSFETERDNYIKILYNNQGIVFKFGLMHEETTTTTTTHNEIIVPKAESLLRQNVISFYYGVSPKRLCIIVNSSIIYDKNNITIGGKDLMQGNAISMFTHQYHDLYLGNNSDNSQSFNGKFYDNSMLHNISELEAINLHEYYKYIHEI